jgi:hypothetical protein
VCMCICRRRSNRRAAGMRSSLQLQCRMGGCSKGRNSEDLIQRKGEGGGAMVLINRKMKRNESWAEEGGLVGCLIRPLVACQNE